ncbi:MAG: divalent metal cation transporter [Chlorobi bacterium]|nr:divalent metal cation transporter [Chlorobiota bacterium]
MNFKNFIKSLGPGLLWAGAAIGVSHLVQSTRAGANFGFYLAGILVFSHVIKYPFFEFGPRYATATGNNLIEGYRKIGKWAVALFAVLTITTMFAIQGAVTIVTAGIFSNIFHLNFSDTLVSAIILVVTMIVLLIGKFNILDKLIKIIIITLAISTIFAVISALGLGYHPNPELAVKFNWTTPAHIAFLIAFLGWLPAPIDISIWHSFWSVAKQKDTNYRPTMKEALLDFKIGYIGTAFLALCFLTLGALLMYGSGEELSKSGTVFAGQLINLYTVSIGQWAYVIIAIAALTTMFSTTLTCLDAYSRILNPTTTILIPAINKNNTQENNEWISRFWMLVVVVGSLLLIGLFASSMRFMVDLATTLSFVTAPILAILNYIVVTDKHMPDDAKPKNWLKIYAWTGIVFLSSFSLAYIIWRFF